MLSKEENFTKMILIKFNFLNFEHNIEKFFNIFVYDNFINKIRKIYDKYFPWFDLYKSFDLIDIYYKNEIMYIKFSISNTKINIKEREFLIRNENELFKNFILSLTKFIKKVKNENNKLYFNLKEFGDISLFVNIERKINVEELINMLKLDEVRENSGFSFNIIGNNFKIWNFERLKNDFRLFRLNDNIRLKNEIINTNRELEIEIKKGNKLIKISNIKGILVEERDINNSVIVVDFHIKDKNNKFDISLTEIQKRKNKNKFIDMKINNKRLEVDMSFNIEDINEFMKLLLINSIKEKRTLFKKTKIWKMIDNVKLITLII